MQEEQGVSIVRRIPVEDKLLLSGMIASNRELASKGIRIIDKDWQLSGMSAVDLIGLDGEGRLVMILLKVAQDDEVLIDALNILDWLLTNRAMVPKMVHPHKVDPLLLPRIVLIAPAFSQRLRTVLRYLSPRVEVVLSTYLCLEVDGKTTLLLEDVEDSGPLQCPPTARDSIPGEERGEGEEKLTLEEIMEFLPKDL